MLKNVSFETPISFAAMLAKGMFIAVIAAICLFAMDASAAVSMANVTTETTTVGTWLTRAGAIAIAVAVLLSLYMVWRSNPAAGVAGLVITVVAATLFAAALI